MKSVKLKIITFILLLTAFIALLNQTVMITALPVISQSFHISLNLTQWLTSGYVLMIGLVTPISARLSEKYTSRQVFISILLGFIVGTILGSFATNFYILLSARLIQAIATGILMSFMQISLISLYPVERRGSVMGLVSLVVSAGPALGPSLAGVLLNYFSWQYLFRLILPVMIILLILSWVYLPNFSTPKPVKIDLLSVFTAVVGMGSILISISLFTSNIPMAVGLLVLGVIVIGYFTRRQLHLTTPLLQLRLLKRRSFLIMLIAIMLAFGIMMGTEAILPVYFETVKSDSPLLAGLVLLPGAAANALVAPMVGRFYDKHGVKWPLLLGSLLLLISSIPLVLITAETSTILIMLDYIVRMIGISMIVSVTITEGLRDLTANEISDGTALNNSLRQVSGSTFTTIMMILVTLRGNFSLGVQVAIWFTVIATVAVIVLSLGYLRKEDA